MEPLGALGFFLEFPGVLTLELALQKPSTSKAASAQTASALAASIVQDDVTAGLQALRQA